MERDLKKDWENLLSQYSTDTNLINTRWEELNKLYTQRSRFYHNLTHLNAMFGELENFKSEIDDLEIVQFAIWYHDIIYSALKKDNEKRSADKAREVLQQLGVSQERVDKCYRLIMLTKTHQIEAAATMDEKYLVDFDLEVLSRDWEDYQIYAKQIRKEYWMFPTLVYKKGRREALKHFLEREYIYQTDFYRTKELQARENILREIASFS